MKHYTDSSPSSSSGDEKVTTPSICFSLCPGADSSGVIDGFNKTVLSHLPQSYRLIIVESILMGAAFIAMIIVRPSETFRLSHVHHELTFTPLSWSYDRN